MLRRLCEGDDKEQGGHRREKYEKGNHSIHFEKTPFMTIAAMFETTTTKIAAMFKTAATSLKTQKAMG
jgi:hypothetical protein